MNIKTRYGKNVRLSIIDYNGSGFNLDYVETAPKTCKTQYIVLHGYVGGPYASEGASIIYNPIDKSIKAKTNKYKFDLSDNIAKDRAEEFFKFLQSDIDLDKYRDDETATGFTQFNGADQYEIDEFKEKLDKEWLRSHTKESKTSSKLFNRLIEDNISIKTTSSSTSDNENKPKNYGEYLDTQVKNAQNQKVNFAKADDTKRRTIAKNYASIAKNKYSNLQGLPKNDNEADEMLKASINKNAMDQAADTTANGNAEAEKAQQEIDELEKSLTESIRKDLSWKARRKIAEARKQKSEADDEAKEYFSRSFRAEPKLGSQYDSLKEIF